MRKQETGKVLGFRQQPRMGERLLERLWGEHSTSLRTFLKARVDVNADVEDMMQEVFIRFARMPDLEARLPQAHRASRAYILTIAANMIVDNERRKSVRRQYQEREWAAENGGSYQLSPEVTVAEIEELDVVEQAIMALPPKWRKAFVLSRFGHLEYKEIAEQMGIATRTVERYISDALLRIRTTVSRATGEGK